MRNLVNLKQSAASPAIIDDQKVRDLIASDKARFRNKEYYHRKNIGIAEGIQSLLDKTANKVTGVTTLEKGGKIEEASAFLLTGIRVRYAYHASDTTVSSKTYSNNIFNPTDVAADATDQNANEAAVQSAPVTVRLIPQNLVDGSDFKLQIAGKDVFITQLGNFFKENLFSDFNRGHEVYVEDLGLYPLLITSSKTIEPFIEMAAGLTDPGGKHFLEWSLVGGEIYE